MDGHGYDGSGPLRASATGRIPQWVRDEAAGRPVESSSGRAWSPPPASAIRRRPRVRGVLMALVAVALTAGAAVLVAPDFRVGAPWAAGPGSRHPTPGVGAADEPLGAPGPAPVADGSYAFVALQRDGSGPVAYDPCRPIHYVVRPDNAPVGGEQILHDAVDRLSAVTGLQFVHDGATDEPPSRDREPFQPERYGDRWAPVLITWETEQENPDFVTDVAGEAGSQWMSLPGGPQVYVTGAVALDAAEFAHMLTVSGGAAVARAVILHELGHLVGLDHVSDAGQLMFPTTSHALDYSDGDLTGLVELGQGDCVPGL
ncbi:matrixin family metalloprotease [Blastococcus mobilis]|uniref:Matrixin n=1 Tax=Blastococcus mobilis TaxID=1938746 RepID=A0A238V9Y5_9ACTN|nr:matrixin family metalloprotease [Blastococcus mobilis]SNR31001.1 Matrixin [Blastococcus mobilis]